jgi:hypothetical protein
MKWNNKVSKENKQADNDEGRETVDLTKAGQRDGG